MNAEVNIWLLKPKFD